MGAFSIERIVTLAVALLAGVALALFFRTPHWMFTLLGSSTAASWVQAVGSLVGLAIAIGVPYSLAKKADRLRAAEAKRRAMGTGLAIRFELKRIKWPLTRILNQWPEGSDAPLIIDLDEGGQREIFEEFKFPKALPEYYGRMHELGDAADDVLMATARADDVKLLLSTLEIDLAHTGGDNQVDIEARLRIKVVSCLEHTNRAIALIDNMFN
ncbi:MAG: hypothetical protein WA777_02850 [Rhodanobacter sp.]